MGVTLLTAYEIANNYPNQILIDSAGDENGFAGFIYRLKGKDIHKLMVSTNYCFKTKNDAIDAMHNICKEMIDNYK